MTKRKATAETPADDTPTIPADVGEGRSIPLDEASAAAIAEASLAAGFPPPPAAARALGLEPEQANSTQASDAPETNPPPAADGADQTKEG